MEGYGNEGQSQEIPTKYGGYRCRQAGPGRYLWQTPHGTCHLVDPTGTHPLDPEAAELILTAPPGVDIYPSAVEIDLGTNG